MICLVCPLPQNGIMGAVGLKLQHEHGEAVKLFYKETNNFSFWFNAEFTRRTQWFRICQSFTTLQSLFQLNNC